MCYSFPYLNAVIVLACIYYLDVSIVVANFIFYSVNHFSCLHCLDIEHFLSKKYGIFLYLTCKLGLVLLLIFVLLFRERSMKERVSSNGNQRGSIRNKNKIEPLVSTVWFVTVSNFIINVNICVDCFQNFQGKFMWYVLKWNCLL